MKKTSSSSRSKVSEKAVLPLNFPDERDQEQTPFRPVVAIVGRPNVGKSTLFNRIVGHRSAIVDDVAGVTRDRNFAECDYQNRLFTLVDTGGLDLETEEVILKQIKCQTQVAIEEADLVIAVMDGRAGLSPMDRDLADLLRPISKPTFLAINKIDTPKSEPLLADFYRLGVEPLFPISAEAGLGVDELLEALLPYLPEAQEELGKEELSRIAVVGRPNVGKSTLINTILGEQRLLVSDVPGTTRDPIDSLVSFEGQRFLFTDTAGLRRRGKIDRGVEGYSVARAIRAVGRSDLAVLVLDGMEGVTEQDTKIAGLIQKQGRACLMMVNKWDLREHDAEAHPVINLEIARRFPFFTHVPVLFGSAIRSDISGQLFPKLKPILSDYSKRIPTRKLNLFLQQLLERNPLSFKRGNPKKSVFITQVSTKPPTFALFIKSADKVPDSYLRYLENAFRQEYGFRGVPLSLLLRKK